MFLSLSICLQNTSIFKYGYTLHILGKYKLYLSLTSTSNIQTGNAVISFQIGIARLKFFLAI